MMAYYQEIGRAGRNGKLADAKMWFNGRDFIMLRSMALSGARTSRTDITLKNILAMEGFCRELGKCRLQSVLNAFGEESKECGQCDNCLRETVEIDVTQWCELVKRGIMEHVGSPTIPQVVTFFMGQSRAREVLQ